MISPFNIDWHFLETQFNESVFKDYTISSAKGNTVIDARNNIHFMINFS